MFTGLIETLGIFESKSLSGKAGKLRVRPLRRFEKTVPGESVAVNGVCLTLEEDRGGVLTFHVMEESFSKTNLGLLERGARVNLERALALGDRMGGHLVSGHVDGTGTLLACGKNGSDMEYRIGVAPSLGCSIVEKGSVALDGVSLTVVEAGEDFFTLRIIPTTMKETRLPFLAPGDVVNIETDMIGKYVEKSLERLFGKKIPGREGGVTLETLSEAGFLE